MIKLRNIMSENNIFVPRRSREEREKTWRAAIYKQIQAYIRNGSKGYLDLSDSPIERLPDNLKHVGGSLDLSYTKITSLPNNLHVGDSLSLDQTPITSLPDNLHVGGYLDLANTPITSLPNNLHVDDGLYLNNTPLAREYTKEQIRAMVPGVKGGIYK